MQRLLSSSQTLFRKVWFQTITSSSEVSTEAAGLNVMSHLNRLHILPQLDFRKIQDDTVPGRLRRT